MTYLIAFNVSAATELAAIEAAVGMLRTGVRLIEVAKAQRVTGALWRVSLRVAEDA